MKKYFLTQSFECADKVSAQDIQKLKSLVAQFLADGRLLFVLPPGAGIVEIEKSDVLTAEVCSVVPDLNPRSVLYAPSLDSINDLSEQSHAKRFAG